MEKNGIGNGYLKNLSLMLSQDTIRGFPESLENQEFNNNRLRRQAQDTLQLFQSLNGFGAKRKSFFMFTQRRLKGRSASPWPLATSLRGQRFKTRRADIFMKSQTPTIFPEFKLLLTIITYIFHFDPFDIVINND